MALDPIKLSELLSSFPADTLDGTEIVHGSQDKGSGYEKVGILLSQIRDLILPKVLTAEGTTGTSITSDGNYTTMTWDSTSRNDFGAAWNGTTFTAPEDGVYDISAVLSCETTGGAATQADMYFWKNSTNQLGFMKVTNGSSQNTVNSRVVASLTTGDTIVARMRQNGGITQPGLSSAVFSIVKLR